MLLRWLLVFFLLTDLHAFAQNETITSAEQLQNRVHQFLLDENKGLPGKVRIQVDAPDPRIQLPFCKNPETFLANGSRATGKIHVGVRCDQPRWLVYLQAEVQLSGSYFVTARALPAGHLLTNDDLRAVEGDMNSLPSNSITSADQAVGKTLTTSVIAGLPLKQTLLRTPWMVEQNQMVKIELRGNRFTISTEGNALQNGILGSNVQVRVANGQVIQAVVIGKRLVSVVF